MQVKKRPRYIATAIFFREIDFVDHYKLETHRNYFFLTLSGLHVRRRLDCAACAVHVRHPVIASKRRARASSVGKTPSFKFCQVDMH